MPQIIAQDDIGTTVQDDSGNVMVIPRGLAPMGMDLANPMPQAMPPPGVGDHIPGMIAQVNGPPPPAPPMPSAPAPVPGQVASLPAPVAPTAPQGVPQQSSPDTVIPAAQARQQAKLESSPFYQADRQYVQALAATQTANQHQADLETQQSNEAAAQMKAGLDEQAAIAAQGAAKQKSDAAQLADLQQKHQATIDDWANTKIDEGHYWANRTTGQQVAGIIGIVLSGIGEGIAGRGGQNPALDMLNNAIKQDVALQIRNKDDKKERISIAGDALDRMRQQAGDDLSGNNMLLAAAEKRTANQLLYTAQKYGGQAAQVRAEQGAATLMAQSAEHSAQSAQGAFQRQQAAQQTAIAGGHLAIAERAQKDAEAQQVRENKRQDVADVWTNLGNAQALANAPAQRAAAAQKAQLDNAKTVSEIQANQARTAKESGEASAAGGTFSMPAAAVRDANGNISVASKTMVQQDGKTPFGKELSPGLRDDLSKKYAAAIKYTTFADQLIDLRQKNGAQWFKTTDGRQMLSKYAQLIAAEKDQMGIQRLSGESIDVLQQATGTSDPTDHQIASVIDDLRSSRDDAVTSLNADFKGAGYTGESIKIPSVGTAPGKDTQAERLLRQAQEDSRVGDGDYNENDYPAILAARVNGETRIPTADALRAVDSLVTSAKKGDEDSLKALDYLSNYSDSTALRHAARAAVTANKLPVNRGEWGAYYDTATGAK